MVRHPDRTAPRRICGAVVNWEARANTPANSMDQRSDAAALPAKAYASFQHRYGDWSISLSTTAHHLDKVLRESGLYHRGLVSPTNTSVNMEGAKAQPCVLCCSPKWQSLQDETGHW